MPHDSPKSGTSLSAGGRRSGAEPLSIFSSTFPGRPRIHAVARPSSRCIVTMDAEFFLHDSLRYSPCIHPMSQHPICSRQPADHQHCTTNDSSFCRISIFSSHFTTSHPTLVQNANRPGKPPQSSLSCSPYAATAPASFAWAVAFFTSNSRHQPLISRSLKIFPITRRSRPLRLALSTAWRERMACSL